MIKVPHDAQERLRALRLWHWREALKWRDSARRIGLELYEHEKKTDGRYTYQNGLADQHIKFVQTLNDFFPVGDNAESDAIG
jgi:hypothetical protein